MPGSNSNHQKWIDLGKGGSVFCGAFSGVMTIGTLVVKEGVHSLSAMEGQRPRRIVPGRRG